MYFSRIRFQRESISAADLSKVLLGDGYQNHQAIWRLFQSPDKQRRDFLFRRDMEDSWPVFFTVSSTQPSGDHGVWRIESKPYDPMIRMGDSLAFSLRANPVVTRWVGDDENKRHARHDVVMEAKARLAQEEVPKQNRPSTVDLAQEHGFAWLEKRSEKSGFAVKQGRVQVDGYQQHLLRKTGKRRPIRLSTLDFSGLLTVTDPDRFRDMLFKGIGPAKSFGCGLMLLRRV